MAFQGLNGGYFYQKETSVYLDFDFCEFKLVRMKKKYDNHLPECLKQQYAEYTEVLKNGKTLKNDNLLQTSQTNQIKNWS